MSSYSVLSTKKKICRTEVFLRIANFPKSKTGRNQIKLKQKLAATFTIEY